MTQVEQETETQTSKGMSESKLTQPTSTDILFPTRPHLLKLAQTVNQLGPNI